MPRQVIIVECYFHIMEAPHLCAQFVSRLEHASHSVGYTGAHHHAYSPLDFFFFLTVAHHLSCWVIPRVSPRDPAMFTRYLQNLQL